ncbi:Hypothetical protein NTJ_09371 [Nesidiocoris tenuis]|uniref:Uncharacterized protein n=1 Tax=Nesidiocoris tenuis TaxID=355587 RepID=A0ABN7AWK1_9HEMI|nr:Hypothetical protein NTJ_09371 [Nesidiocoris tenuis]
MAGKHVCQLNDVEKADILHNLRQAVNRLEDVSGPRDPKYRMDRLPNFLIGRVPKFKPNPELQPPITHAPTLEIRFTTDKKVASARDDPQIIYSTMPGPHNPFKPSYMVSDKLCTDFCSEAEPLLMPSNMKRPTVSPICLSKLQGEPPKDGAGYAYDCEYNRKHEQFAVCHPQKGDQHYLCTRK